LDVETPDQALSDRPLDVPVATPKPSTPPRWRLWATIVLLVALGSGLAWAIPTAATSRHLSDRAAVLRPQVAGRRSAVTAASQRVAALNAQLVGLQAEQSRLQSTSQLSSVEIRSLDALIVRLQKELAVAKARAAAAAAAAASSSSQPMSAPPPPIPSPSFVPPCPPACG
jgi:hypothetical protein